MSAQAEAMRDPTIPTENEESTDSLLQIRNLKKHFSLSGDFLDQLKFKGGKLVRHQEYVHAINGVNLDIKRGEALCVVAAQCILDHKIKFGPVKGCLALFYLCFDF